MSSQIQNKATIIIQKTIRKFLYKKYKKDYKFYIQSLMLCEKDIFEKSKTKALKDVVGDAYEEHRKRLWMNFGFDANRKEKNNSMGFNVDIIVRNNIQNNICVLEETKGHYLDSCFMERAIIGFAKTISKHKVRDNECPLLLIHSFTKYKRFNEKLDEIYSVLHPNIVDILKNKLRYTTIANSDRLAKKKWFKKDVQNHPYLDNYNINQIIQDIIYIKNITKK